MGKKNGRPNRLQDNCGRKLFLNTFGRPLEEYETYKRAAESLRKSTRVSMAGTLSRYFVYLGENPDQVIANRQADLASVDATINENYERKTKTYAKLLIDQELAGYTVATRVGRIQSFFSNNGRRLSLDLRRLKLPKARKVNKYSPSNIEVRQLLAVADGARDKLIVALMYQNGPAPVDVSVLKVGDYPVDPWCYFELPRSKNGEVWRGVSMPDICEYLRAYLTVRGKAAHGEPLIIGRQGPLGNQAVSEIVSGLIQKAGLGSIVGFKPYSLRDAFEDALSEAEVYHKVKEAMMGHTSDIEHHYGGHNRMTTALVAAAKKAYPLLCLGKQPAVAVDGFSVEELGMLRDLLLGIKEGKIKMPE